MNDFKITKEEQEIIDSAKRVSLSVAEKNRIKNNLISYTNANPISHTVKNKSIPSFFWSRAMYFVPALAMLLLVIGLNTGKSNTTEQIASHETVDTTIQDTIPTTELFKATSLTAPSVESATSFAEPAVAEEPVNTRMMKSSPAPEGNAVMMMSASVEVATNTASSTSSSKHSSSIEKIKEQINTTYTSFISKLFNKSKKEVKKEENKKADKNSKKKGGKNDDKKSKNTSAINDDKNSGVNELEIEIEKVETKDDDEDGDDDNKYVIQPLPPVTPPVKTTVTSYTLIEVAKHDVSSDCWSVVSGGVYNLTSWIAKHPGGESAIKGMCGVDGTTGFLAQHNGDTKAVNTLSSYKIGILK
jgi:cytochrome b involved in lipid metabolism